MKKIMPLIICFALSCLIVLGWPFLDAQKTELAQQYPIEKNLISQDIIGYSENKKLYHKLYYQGNLLAVINDLDRFNEGIDLEYKNYEDKFPNTTLGLCDDAYIVNEYTYAIFEDVDEEILDYVVNNKLLGVKTHAIELSTKEGIFDIIYVNDLDDFYTARNHFLSNFISEETLELLRNNTVIADPVDFGTIEKNLKIQETISFTDAFASPDKIYTDVNEIYEYLCYGRNEERQYYQTVAGDTLNGVGYRFQNMSPKQLMMLNPDVISAEDQILTPGMSLNVTYFSSPLTVVVTKERLAQVVVNAENPEYRTDDSLPSGVTRVDVKEVSGLENVLYEETWVNGVLQSGEQKSSVMVREPVRAIITLGTQTNVHNIGTGSFIWPCDNPKITCGWGCYVGHTGTDIVNQYSRIANIYAVDSGTVEIASYHYINGNYIVIDHGNGIKSYVGHLAEMYVNPGDTVERGQTIGLMGATGLAFGVHVHFHMIIDGVITNACSIMDCSSIPWS